MLQIIIKKEKAGCRNLPQLAESVRLATPLARLGKVDRTASNQMVGSSSLSGRVTFSAASADTGATLYSVQSRIFKCFNRRKERSLVTRMASQPTREPRSSYPNSP